MYKTLSKVNKIVKPATFKKWVKKEANKIISKKFYSTLNDPLPTGYSSSVQESLEGTPYYAFPNVLTQLPKAKETTLKNGFRVVTEYRQGETASVGVFIKAGSRQETEENNGVAHFLEHMYFKGTPKRTATSLEVEYEDAGAQMNAHTTREYTCFTSHCLKNDIERSVDSLSDVLLNSNITEKDIEAERSTILREQEEVNTNIEEVLFDLLHEAAFSHSSLGYPILGPKKNIESLTKQQMLEYRDTHYIAPKMVLVGVGEVNHEDLVKLGEKYFGALPSKAKEGCYDPTGHNNYVGSEARLFDENIPYMYSAIGFQGPAIDSPDMMSVNLMQILLGAWDRSMGVGKHIQSHLCAVVADEHLAYSVSSFNHAYTDTCLFGVQAVNDGNSVVHCEKLNIEMVSQMTRLCYKVTKDELERAKNILKTQILTQYEGQLDNVCEEVGKQILFYGRRPPLAEMFARIDSITADTLMNVAQKYVLDQDPVSAAVGNCEHFTDYSWLKMFTYYWRT